MQHYRTHFKTEMPYATIVTIAPQSAPGQAIMHHGDMRQGQPQALEYRQDAYTQPTLFYPGAIATANGYQQPLRLYAAPVITQTRHSMGRKNDSEGESGVPTAVDMSFQTLFPPAPIIYSLQPQVASGPPFYSYPSYAIPAGSNNGSANGKTEYVALPANGTNVAQVVSYPAPAVPQWRSHEPPQQATRSLNVNSTIGPHHDRSRAMVLAQQIPRQHNTPPESPRQSHHQQIPSPSTQTNHSPIQYNGINNSPAMVAPPVVTSYPHYHNIPTTMVSGVSAAPATTSAGGGEGILQLLAVAEGMGTSAAPTTA